MSTQVNRKLKNELKGKRSRKELTLKINLIR